MKNLLVAVAAVALALTPVACNMSHEGGTPGSGGNTITDKQAFTLSTPPGATHLKPNEEKTVTISIHRGSQFTDPVALKAESQDRDVKAELSKSTAESSDKEVTLKVRADKDAAFGDHIIKVTGTPKEGKPATLEVKVTVDKP